MKNLTILLLSLFSGFSALYAQPQKGDFTIGNSILSVENAAEEETLTSVSPSVGYFFGDNTLLGGGVGYINNGFNNVTSVSVFGQQYFTKGGFRPFGALNASILFGDGESLFLTTANIGFAIFPASNASVELSYGFLPFAASGGRSEFFPADVPFNLNLGMKFFLRPGEEGDNSDYALNSIVKGTKCAGLSGALTRPNDSETNYNLNARAAYFVTDGVYLTGALSATGASSDGASSSLNFWFPGFGAGLYHALQENIYLQGRFNGDFGIFSFKEDGEKQTNTISSLSLRAGPAFFFGAHKIEPFVGYNLLNLGESGNRVSQGSLFFNIDYEYFVSARTSFTASFLLNTLSNETSLEGGNILSTFLQNDMYAERSLLLGVKFYLAD